jgi:hypothetical protein
MEARWKSVCIDCADAEVMIDPAGHPLCLFVAGE